MIMEKNRKGIEKQDGAHLNFLCLQEDSNDEIASKFHDDGFVCLSDVISHETIEEWREWGAQHMINVFETLHEHKHTPFSDPQREIGEIDDGQSRSLEYSLGTGIKHGFREIVMRSPGRYEISVRECEDHPSLVEVQEKLGTVIPAILGEESLADLTLCHVSLVTASPSATDQGWHADGGHTNIQTHMPCHCLNIFIPLVDITIENGPTELRPASHYITRNLAPMMLAARARKTLRSPVTPTPKRGDLLVFDYRILHRGRANHSLTTDRPILVLTYAKSWFKDICNFPSRSLFDPKLPDVESKSTK
jgi:hypothetical protein